MYIVSSPKAVFASVLAVLYAGISSSSFLTTLIPRPPPPAEAFIITGYPIFRAEIKASSSESMAPSEPGTTGTPAFIIISLAFDLLPILSILLESGPINFILHSSHICANLLFSDKNPKPG